MELEEKLKVVFSRWKSQPGPCPDFETLVGFLEKKLSPKLEAEVRRHLCSCSSCQELVKLYLESEDIFLGRVSRRIINRAKTVFKPNWFQRVLSGMRERFSGTSWTGEVLSFQPVRSSFSSNQGKVFSYQERIYPYQIRTEVVHLENELFQIWVEAYNPQLCQRSSGLRVNLKEGEKELESLVLEQGRAVFEPVPKGNYLLEFWENRDFLGGIEILIKERKNERAG